MGYSSRVPVGICPVSVEPVTGEPMSSSLEPVISTAQASPEARGHAIGDQLGDRHIHHPIGHARYGTGVTRILDDRRPDPPIALVRLRWADHIRRAAS